MEDPKLIPQPHGGALLSGGKKGNPGGRKPDELKELMLHGGIESIRQILRRLEQDPDGMTVADLARIAEIGGRYNLAEKREVENKVSPEEAARRIAQHINGRQEQ